MKDDKHSCRTWIEYLLYGWADYIQLDFEDHGIHVGFRDGEFENVCMAWVEM